MAEMVQAPQPPVPLAGGIHQRQVARLAAGLQRDTFLGEVEFLQRDRDSFGKADADEAPRRHRVAVADQPHRIHRRDHLAAMAGAQRRQERMVLFVLHGAVPV